MSRNFNGTAGNVLSVNLEGTGYEAAPITISFWFKPAATPLPASIPIFVGTTAGEVWNARYIQFPDATKLQSIIVGNNDFVSYSAANVTTTITTGTWYQCVVTADLPSASCKNQIFINGTITDGLTTTNVTAFSNYVSGLVIGGGWTGTTPAFPVTGDIADVGLWDVLLNTTEIAQLGAGTKRPGQIRTANLRGWWKLEGTASPEPNSFGALPSAQIIGTVPGSADPPYPTGSTMVADFGAYSFGGQATEAFFGKRLVLDAGMYAFTGKSVVFETTAARSLLAERGLYNFSGREVMLLRSGGGTLPTPRSRVYVIPRDSDI